MMRSRKFLFSKMMLNCVFGLFNLLMVRKSDYHQTLSELDKANVSRFQETRNGYLFKFLSIVENPKKTLAFLPDSKSQLFQDLFVLEKLNWKRNGYFVEFGATNGIDLSNSYLLEREFSWDGLLVEPGKIWHEKLRENRRVDISTKCVWKSSGEMINFNESIYPEFSTIYHLTNFDGMQNSRASIGQYMVETTSLQKLLDDAKAPKFIDYISIDTEGSEYEILNSFDFSKYEFGVLTVEHNFNQNEEKIDKLLSGNGYLRVHREISEFDGWYLNTKVQREK